ncbi:DUF4097 family beta strand repeat-containing protein [Demequina flava]|uniref:DUF4097 family beta strand repeat-containing protein n=1 Tax=Demequina flava TaxID=1095025 RepID=UPI0007835F26|nr:DUF4097 family beta strand repeat-containing protein [Demequina flava]
MSAPEITGVRVDIPAGRIEVVAVPGRDEVSVVVNPSNRSRAGDREAAENASVERAGEVVVVAVPTRTTVFGKPDSVDVIIEGPEGLNIDANTKYGEIRLAGAVGAVRVAAQHGQIRADAVGTADIRGGNGKVQIGTVAGDSTVTVSNGAARVGAVGGALSLRATNGSIGVDDVRGEATLETTNGSIKVGAVTGALEARSTHGAVRVRDLSGGTARLETSMGSVKVGVRRGAPVWLDASSGHGKVTTDLDADSGPVEGEQPVELHVRTGYGAVAVTRV